MRKGSIIGVLGALCAVIWTPWVHAETEVVGDFMWEYEVVDDTSVRITGVMLNEGVEESSLKVSTFTIPETLGGSSVAQMTTQTFGHDDVAWKLKVNTIVFPSTLETIVKGDDEWAPDTLSLWEFFPLDTTTWTTSFDRSLTLKFLGSAVSFGVNSGAATVTLAYPINGASKTSWEEMFKKDGVFPAMDAADGGLTWHDMLVPQFKPQFATYMSELQTAITKAGAGDANAAALAKALNTLVALNTNAGVRSALATFGLNLKGGIFVYEDKNYDTYTYQPNTAADLLVGNTVYPQLKSAIASLASIKSSWDGMLKLAADDVPWLLSGDLYLDVADAKTLKAMLEGVCASAQLARSYNLPWNYKNPLNINIAIPKLASNTEANWKKVPTETIDCEDGKQVEVQVATIGNDLCVRLVGTDLAESSCMVILGYEGNYAGKFAQRTWRYIHLDLYASGEGVGWGEYGYRINGVYGNESDLTVTQKVVALDEERTQVLVTIKDFATKLPELSYVSCLIYNYNAGSSCEFKAFSDRFIEIASEQIRTQKFAYSRRTGANLAEAKTKAKSAFLSAADALEALMAREDDREHLFNFVEGMEEEDLEAYKTAAKALAQSVDAATEVTIGDFSEKVNLAKLFSLEGPTAQLLPPLDAEGDLDWDAVEDPSFCGILPERVPQGTMDVQVVQDTLRGKVTGEPTKLLSNGASVTLKATPANLCSFVQWEDAETGEVLSASDSRFIITSGSSETASITFRVKCSQEEEIQTLKVRARFKAPPELTVTVEEGQETFGTVSGGGLYAVGKTATLKATPKKGYAFAGWYEEGAGTPLTGSLDYRTPTFTFAMPEADTAVVGKFVEASKDTLSVSKMKLNVEGADSPYEHGSIWSIEPNVSQTATFLVESESLPKVTVTGIPAGLKFDAKTFKLSGTATKPGVYAMTFTVTNSSVAAKDAAKFTITTRVLNINELEVEDVNEVRELRAGLDNGGIEGSISLKLDGTKASGLPSGLKWDSQSATFSGVTQKPGTYTITFTKDKKSSTLTFVVTGPTLTIEEPENGTLAGAGTYYVGQKVALKATPKAGYTFAGWYKKTIDETPDVTLTPLEGLVDYRTATFTYTMPDEDVAVVGKFAVTREDELFDSGVMLKVEDTELPYTQGSTWEIKPNTEQVATLVVESNSFPKVTVKGLPAGLKFDAKSLKLSGKATTPGTYTLTFTVTNSYVTASNVAKLAMTVYVKAYNELDVENADEVRELRAGKENGGLMDAVSENLKGSTASGLPAGLKWDSANATFSGITQKTGTYVITFTNGKKRTTLTFKVTAPKLTIESDVNGTLTGAGTYYVGQKVTLKATPKKGYVFAGWYEKVSEGTEPWLESELADYRTPTFTYTMPDRDITVSGKFVKTTEDVIGAITFTPDVSTSYVSNIWSIQPLAVQGAKLEVVSSSLPKVTVKGLPAGLKFDAKTLKISGKATTPGTYTTTFTVNNTSVTAAKDAKTLTITIRVLNINDLGVEDVNTPIAIEAGADGGHPILPAELLGATASGLPAGLRWTADGELVGTTWKPGKYTVTFTKRGVGRTTLTFEIDPEPPVFNEFYVSAEDGEGTGICGEPFVIDGTFKVSTVGGAPKMTVRGLPSGFRATTTLDNSTDTWLFTCSGVVPTNASGTASTITLVATDPKTGLQEERPITVNFVAGEEESYGHFFASEADSSGVKCAALAYHQAGKGSGTLRVQLPGTSELSLKQVSAWRDAGQNTWRRYELTKGSEMFSAELVASRSEDSIEDLEGTLIVEDTKTGTYTEYTLAVAPVWTVKEARKVRKLPVSGRYAIAGLCDGLSFSGTVTLSDSGEASLSATVRGSGVSIALTCKGVLSVNDAGKVVYTFVGMVPKTIDPEGRLLMITLVDPGSGFSVLWPGEGTYAGSLYESPWQR